VAEQRQRAVERRPSVLDLLGVPQRPVLIAQQHDVAVAEPGPAAGVVQQHQCEQPMHLGLVGHQLGDRSPQPQRFVRKVAAGGRGRISLVEDQVDDREHRGEPVGQQVGGGHAERDRGGLDLALGPHQALGHRRLADQECSGDLLGRETAERPQRQRDLRVGCERRMAAGEDELQPLICKHVLVHCVLHRFG